MNIKDYGFDYEINSNDSIGTPARITALHKGRFAVVSDFGEGYAQLKGKEYYYGNEVFPTVGDFVLIDYNSRGDSRIIKTLERRTFFSRRDPDKGRGEQAVAANFDYVFIMHSLNHDFNPKRLERYLTAARQSKAEPVVVLTKADLTDDYLPYILETSRVAENVRTCIVSSKTGYGMDELSQYMQKGKTLVFLGSSGVGKSSLVNALAGEKIMDVNGIREDDSKGRHTTTHRELIMLQNGVMIIDTPGMRELGMWDVTEGLDDAFSDVERFAEQCRFRDCRHVNEPGCAVRRAIEKGELIASRFESYQKLKSEAKYGGSAADYRKKKEQFFKNLAISEKKRERLCIELENNIKPINIIIRNITDKDHYDIELVTKRAFWNLYMPGCDEHYLVHKLWNEPCYIPELSLAAKVDNKIVGAILYSRSRIETDSNSIDVLSFGPLCVDPDYQRTGIGKKLLLESIKIATEKGYKAIFICGVTEYYPRFGFKTADTFGITMPDGSNFDAFMGYELQKDALKGVNGRFYEASVFDCDVHDEAYMKAVDEFDKSFPYMEKQVLPNQWR